ncbi:Ger(x)C family spore germination protein [Lentibacillus sediminis]|uniref:Ger(x)C family spore germination protein n=1 Tax=Lentibacillus sediminis TaxID=1940529 RepID=UPI000C1C32EC|nr:Ger(x)C family spore germination protein [Lentibacillus sediminis]
MALLVLTACVPTKIIEKVAIINSYGIDAAEEGQIEKTIIAFRFDDEAQNIATTLSGTANTVRGAEEDAANKTSFTLKPGQIRLVVYGKEIAENGISPYINVLVRDARVSSMMYTAISTGTAKEVLTAGQENTPANIGQYLQDLIEKEIKQNTIPDVSFFHFTHALEDTGQDPILPLLGIRDNKAALIGMAVMDNGKYAGEISLKDAFLVNLFQKNIRDKPLEVSISKEPFSDYIEGQLQTDDEQLHISTLITDGRTRTKMTDVGGLEFQTEVNLKVNLYETSEPMRIRDEKAARLLEKEMEKKITKQYEQLLASLKETGSDPFGLGNIYRIKKESGKLTEQEWDEKFPEVTVDFKVNVQLVNYGSVR